MAKKKEEIEITICDFCGERTGDWDKCIKCGKDVCRKHQVEFSDIITRLVEGIDGNLRYKVCQDCLDIPVRELLTLARRDSH